jgi:hypothetical protein
VRILNISVFPKYKHHCYFNSEYDQFHCWASCLVHDGFTSAHYSFEEYQLQMSDEDYVWFVLKWS